MSKVQTANGQARAYTHFKSFYDRGIYNGIPMLVGVRLIDQVRALRQLDNEA